MWSDKENFLIGKVSPFDIEPYSKPCTVDLIILAIQFFFLALNFKHNNDIVKKINNYEIVNFQLTITVIL